MALSEEKRVNLPPTMIPLDAQNCKSLIELVFQIAIFRWLCCKKCEFLIGSVLKLIVFLLLGAQQY